MYRIILIYVVLSYALFRYITLQYSMTYTKPCISFTYTAKGLTLMVISYDLGIADQIKL